MNTGVTSFGGDTSYTPHRPLQGALNPFGIIMEDMGARI